MRRPRIGATALFAAAVAAAPTTLWGQSNEVDIPNRGAIRRPTSAFGQAGLRPAPGFLPAGNPTEGGTDGTWIGGAGGAPDSFLVFGAPSAPADTAPQDFLNWSTGTNWSGGAFPTAGGSAVIGALGPSTDTERLGDNIIFLDVDVSLSELDLRNSRGVDITPTLVANPVRNITPAAGGLTIRSSEFFPEPQDAGFPNPGYVFFGQVLQANIIGAGATVTVDGGGGGNIAPIVFAGVNTFSGGLTVRNGGIVSLSEIGASTADPQGQPVVNDLGLGTGAVTLDGGRLRGFSGLAAPTVPNPLISQNFIIGPGGGDIQFGGTTPPTFSGQFSGSGRLSLGPRGFASTYTFSGDNSAFTGIVDVPGGAMTLNGPGNFRGASAINALATALRLDNSLGAADRVGDTATVRMVGSEIRMNGSAETLGTLIAGGGLAAVTYESTSGTTMITGDLGRENRGLVFFRGTNIGTTGPKFVAPNAAAIAIGAGGAAGTTTRSVIPWAFGVLTPSATANTQTGGGTGSFMTFDVGGNLKPLDLASEHAAGFGVATSNVNITASTAAGATTVNSLRLGSVTNSPTGAAPTLSGGPITITSGGLLNTVNLAVITAGITTPAGTELVIIASGDHLAANPATITPTTAVQGLNIQGVISGSGGLTKAGPAALNLGGANTYTGITTLGSGRTFITATVPSNKPGDPLNGPNPFGLDASAIRLVPSGANAIAGLGAGASQLRFINETGTSLRFGRDIEVVDTGSSGIIALGGFNAASATEFYGNINIASANTPLWRVGGSRLSFTGQITGAGGFQDLVAAATTTFFPSNPAGNTFTGGVQINLVASAQAAAAQVVYEVGGVNPLGTGNVYMTGSTIRAVKDLIGTVATGADPAVTLPNNFIVDPTENTTNQDDRTFDGNLNLTGSFDFGGIGPVSMPIPATGNVTMAGTLKNGSFRKVAVNSSAPFTAPVAGSNTFSSGRLTLTGNNTTDTRVFIGTRGFQADAAPTFDVPGGLVVLASDGAMGNAGIQVESNGSAVALRGGITTPAGRNIFLRTSNGYLNGVGVGTGSNSPSSSLSDLTNVVASGALFSMAAPVEGTNVNTLGGNVNLISSSSIGADAGTTLQINGFLSDFTGQGKTPTTGGSFTVQASSATLTKVGPGIVSVNRLADTNIFDLTGEDANGNDGTAVLVPAGVSSLANVNVTAGTLRITQGSTNNDTARVSAVRNLTVAAAPGGGPEVSSAQVDITNQSLLVDYNGASPAVALEDLVREGRNTNSPVLWTGNGISSSAAAGGSTQFPGGYAVGIAESTNTTSSGTFLGFPMDTDTVVVAFTLSGDANLDFTADISDFARLGANFNKQDNVPPGLDIKWSDGDFNYDNKVDIGDFALLGANFNGVVPAAGLPRGAAVPEPTTLGLIGLAAMGLGRRRRVR